MERPQRKHSDSDRRDAKDTDPVPKRESRRKKSRSQYGSRDQPRTRPSGETTAPEKSAGNGASRNRSPPARKRSSSRSSSDSEVVYGKVQSKVDVKRAEVPEGGKPRSRRSPSPVSTSTGKGRSEETKSSGRGKEEAKRNGSGVKKITASYSSDSSESPSPERDGRRMQSTIVEQEAQLLL